MTAARAQLRVPRADGDHPRRAGRGAPPGARAARAGAARRARGRARSRLICAFSRRRMTAGWPSTGAGTRSPSPGRCRGCAGRAARGHRRRARALQLLGRHLHHGGHLGRGARAAAACAHAAAAVVAAGRGRPSRSARPPGHHAHADLYGGYCYLNNAAVAAETLRAAGAARVAVLDIDYHHGNGTQAIFYERGDVLTVSIHADPAAEFPYFLGHADETGAGAGLGPMSTCPCRHGTDRGVVPRARPASTRSCGTGRRRSWSRSASTPTRAIRSAASGSPRGTSPRSARGSRAIGLPTVLVMEGGYAVEALGRERRRGARGIFRRLIWCAAGLRSRLAPCGRKGSAHAEGADDHPQRYALTNELHARPFQPVTVPGRVVHLALKRSENGASERDPRATGRI